MRKRSAPPRAFLDADGATVAADEEEEERPARDGRGGAVAGAGQESSDSERVVRRINTHGLAAFIRPIKYGLLQLASSAAAARSPLSDKFCLRPHPPLHVRLWLNDNHLLLPIPANLVVFSPAGDKVLDSLFPREFFQDGC